MLIRFQVFNLLSFGTTVEFNTLAGRSSRLAHHVRPCNGCKLVRQTALYGPNGAGKSNLIKSIAYLQTFVRDGSLPSGWIANSFKLNPKANKSSGMGIEFCVGQNTFWYTVAAQNGLVVHEELQSTGAGKNPDFRIFRRTDDGQTNSRPHLEFSNEWTKHPDWKSLLKYAIEEHLDRNESLLHFFLNRHEPQFEPCAEAAQWLVRNLILVGPNSRPNQLPLLLERNPAFAQFANDIFRNSGTGIERISVQTSRLEDYFGQDNPDKTNGYTAKLLANPQAVLELPSATEKVLALVENGQPVTKRLLYHHTTNTPETVAFNAPEESDGTRRLTELLPAFFTALNEPTVFLLDEIERSMHPTLIRVLLEKYASESKALGQIIYTTHETHLLDQDLLRPDEIWFVEKSQNGETRLHSLNDFKFHHTLDVRKGYLHGRFGAIPSLTSLKNQNWNHHVVES